MLTHGFFATSYRSPAFPGVYDTDQPSGPWATPRFAPDQVSQIINWVMSAPDDGEIIGWQGNTVIHQLGVAEPDRTDIILPDPDGRYGIGWQSWTWIERPPPETSGPGQVAAHEPPPLPTAVVTVSGPGPEIGPDQPPEPETVIDRVHSIGLRRIEVRTSSRGSAGFDIFAGGQRLTHAQPFPTEPTHDQVESFLSTRKRCLDLLIAEHGTAAEDLYALLHSTRSCPRYAAIARDERAACISLHETLAEAAQHLRDHVARDTRARIVGVQDLDGPFLPAQVQIILASPEQAQGRRTGRHTAGAAPAATPSPSPTPSGDQSTSTEADPVDEPGGLLAPSPGSTPSGRGRRTAIIRPRTRGTRPPRRHWGIHCHTRRPDSVPARELQRPPALGGRSALRAVLGRCLVVVATLALAMTTLATRHPCTLTPRHRAARSRFLSAPSGQRRRAARSSAAHLSTQ